MEEWKEYRLGEIGTIVGGATPSTKDVSNYDGNISWLTPKDLSIHTERYIKRGERMISLKGYNSCSCKMLPKGSILFSSRAPIGYVAIASKELCTNQGFKSIIPFKEKVDSLFLYYLLIYNRKKIEGLGSGTTFKEVSLKVMQNVKVSIPSLTVQQNIASILSSLDSKIEINNKINSNLEEQAKALFKSWFIDFEPFKDEKFVDSELGKIPEGWKVRRLDEVSKIVGGGTPSKSKPQYFSHNGIHWITPKDLSLSHAKFTSSGADDITIEGYNNSSARLMPKGTVLFSSRAPIGYISIALNELCTNQGFKSVVPQELNTIYLYYYLKFHVKDIEAKASGSTFKEVSGSLMKSIPIIVPSANVVDKFENVLTPIFNYQAHIEKENSQLSSLRDTLLPKLMSGEIDVEHSKLLFI